MTTKAGNMNQRKTIQINVTNLTPKQRQKLFTKHLNQNGFTAFIKNQKNNQTHYTFQYQN